MGLIQVTRMVRSHLVIFRPFILQLDLIIVLSFGAASHLFLIGWRASSACIHWALDLQVVCILQNLTLVTQRCIWVLIVLSVSDDNHAGVTGVRLIWLNVRCFLASIGRTSVLVVDNLASIFVLILDLLGLRWHSYVGRNRSTMLLDCSLVGNHH